MRAATPSGTREQRRRGAKHRGASFRVVLAALCLALGVAAATGCSSGAEKQDLGTLLLTRDGEIFAYDIASAGTRPLIGDADGLLSYPAASRDGSKIAFVRQAPGQSPFAFGTDLWIARRDGSNQRQLFAHSEPNQLVLTPQWLDDDHLLAIVQETSTIGGQTGLIRTLERFDTAGGERRKLFEPVLSFAIGPDRQHVAYSTGAPGGGQVLRYANLDGSEARTLVTVEAEVGPFNSPQFSPDGDRIAFAGADLRNVGGLGRPLVSFRPSPNGFPEDIWIVDAEGGSPERIAPLLEDLPTLTWGRDEDRMYVLGATALYEVNRRSGAVNQIGEGSFHGQVAWTP